MAMSKKNGHTWAYNTPANGMFEMGENDDKP